MLRSSSRSAFTLIEMLTVMLVIAILAGIILSVNGLAQNKSSRTRAEGEIHALSAGCENYKTDNGGYPRTTNTDSLDPRVSGNPNTAGYTSASLDLYVAISGDVDMTFKNSSTAQKNYLPDFFKPTVLHASKDSNGVIQTVNYLQDPFGNCYGYSTAANADEETFEQNLRTSTNAKNLSRPSATRGYNPTFDLWSTAGATTDASASAKWVKNW